MQCFVYLSKPKQFSPDKCQELAVPKHCKYEALFGCSFLFADRSSLFITADTDGKLGRLPTDTQAPSEEDTLDFLGKWGGTKNNIYTCGWDEHLQADEFSSFLQSIKFFPSDLHRVGVFSDRTSA
jgi:hypothetical protein